MLNFREYSTNCRHPITIIPHFKYAPNFSHGQKMRQGSNS